MLKFIFKYAKKYWWQISLMLIFTALSARINLILPQYTSKIINEGVAMKNLDKIYGYGFEMIGISLLAGISMIISIVFAVRSTAAIARDLRQDTFSKIESFSMQEFGKFNVASLITRTTNDASQFQQTFAMTMRMGIYAPAVGIGAIMNVFAISSKMSWVVFACVAMITILVSIITVFAVPKLKKIQKNIDNLNLQIRQTLTGLRVIRAYRNEKKEEEKFAVANQENYNTSIFVERIFALISPFMTLISGLSAVAVVFFGSKLIESGELQVGDIFALIQYVMQTTFAFVMLSMIFTFLPRMIVSVNRIREVLDTEISVKDAKKSSKMPKDFSIKFENVNFKYAESEACVLENLNFEISQGETIAIIGGTGSGKSTLAKLIPRFYDVSSGKITIGGVDISKIPQKNLRDLVAYVSQKAIIFSGDVRSNVAYGGEISDEEIIEALKISQAWDFVSNLPNGLDEVVVQGGKNFSGGQKQRLSIARAIAKKAPIMIFDDSFSALDYQTDAKLRAELSKKTADRTKIIVAQRVATIANADKIIVLDDGKIVGLGEHGELLKSNELYREIALSQFSQDEIEKEIADFEKKKSNSKGEK